MHKYKVVKYFNTGFSWSPYFPTVHYSEQLIYSSVRVILSAVLNLLWRWSVLKRWWVHRRSDIEDLTVSCQKHNIQKIKCWDKSKPKVKHGCCQREKLNLSFLLYGPEHAKPPVRSFKPATEQNLCCLSLSLAAMDSLSQETSELGGPGNMLKTLDPILITIIAMSALGVFLGAICGVVLYCACSQGTMTERNLSALENYNFELVDGVKLKKDKMNGQNNYSEAWGEKQDGADIAPRGHMMQPIKRGWGHQ